VQTYTVHEQPNPPAGQIDRAEKLAFVRDGFRWSAFLFTPLWLLAKRLWLPLLAFLAAAIAIAGSVEWLDLDPQWGTLFALAAQLAVGFEAGSLERWRLDRLGWAVTGTVTGRTREEAERRFFTAWLSGQPAAPPGKTEGAERAARVGRGFMPWRGLGGRLA